VKDFLIYSGVEDFHSFGMIGFCPSTLLRVTKSFKTLKY